MPDAYSELLDATLRHLEDLKTQGVRHVVVSPATLAALSAPTPRRPASMEPRTAGPAASSKVLAAEVGVNRPAEPTSKAPLATAAPAPPQQAAFAALLGTTPTSPATPPLAPEAREAAMADLRTRAAVCQKCPNLAAARRNVVFGVGDIHSPLMFVGEAPGADEDEQGVPFVGRAGQLLTKIIEAIELKREDVYIANVIKCRPPQNRNPEPDEVETCEPYLFRQIDAIKPAVIVALGKFGAQTLLRSTEPISRLRGRVFDFRGAKLVPTFHPAYLLRNPPAKREVWEDMKLVKQLLSDS
jgi:uracil-DNA glycosylase family 4